MQKLTDADFSWHRDQPDVPQKTGAQMKAFFDAPIRTLMDHANRMIDEIDGQTAENQKEFSRLQGTADAIREDMNEADDRLNGRIDGLAEELADKRSIKPYVIEKTNLSVAEIEDLIHECFDNNRTLVWKDGLIHRYASQIHFTNTDKRWLVMVFKNVAQSGIVTLYRLSYDVQTGAKTQLTYTLDPKVTYDEIQALQEKIQERDNYYDSRFADLYVDLGESTDGMVPYWVFNDEMQGLRDEIQKKEFGAYQTVTANNENTVKLTDTEYTEIDGAMTLYCKNTYPGYHMYLRIGNYGEIDISSLVWSDLEATATFHMRTYPLGDKYVLEFTCYVHEDIQENYDGDLSSNYMRSTLRSSNTKQAIGALSLYSPPYESEMGEGSFSGAFDGTVTLRGKKA